MKVATAWILDFGAGNLAAVGERELIHLDPEPTLFAVPQTPRHCRHVLWWQERLLPVWDVAAWLGPAVPERPAQLAGIVGYQARRREFPRFGVLLLAAPPFRVKASDDDACALPAQPAEWDGIAIACFTYRDAPVPVLDLRRMFGAPRARAERVDVLAAA